MIVQFLEHCKGRQAWLDEKEATNRKLRRWFNIAVVVAVVAVLASLWAGWAATNKAKIAEQRSMTAQKHTEERLKEANHNFGLALNERAKAAEKIGGRLYAHLYSLYAIDKLSQNKDEVT